MDRLFDPAKSQPRISFEFVASGSRFDARQVDRIDVLRFNFADANSLQSFQLPSALILFSLEISSASGVPQPVIDSLTSLVAASAIQQITMRFVSFSSLSCVPRSEGTLVISDWTSTSIDLATSTGPNSLTKIEILCGALLSVIPPLPSASPRLFSGQFASMTLSDMQMTSTSMVPEWLDGRFGLTLRTDPTDALVSPIETCASGYFVSVYVSDSNVKRPSAQQKIAQVKPYHYSVRSTHPFDSTSPILCFL